MNLATRIALILFAWGVAGAHSETNPAIDFWGYAKERADTHRFSTLFTAYDSKNHLSTDEGIDRAIAWCKRTAVTKVYLESFRDGVHADRETLVHARDRFLAEGFMVSGCVTTTEV